MKEFLANIDNKEIFIEVLHHSIDYLIENVDDQNTIRLCHKYGFQNPDEFLSATRNLSTFFTNCLIDNNCIKDVELNTKFDDLNPLLRSLIPQVLSARRPEILKYLLRRQLSVDRISMESFDWDTRIIAGDSNFPQSIRQLTTLTLYCRKSNFKKIELHFQINKNNLSEFIAVLKNAL